MSGRIQIRLSYIDEKDTVKWCALSEFWAPPEVIAADGGPIDVALYPGGPTAPVKTETVASMCVKEAKALAGPFWQSLRNGNHERVER